MLERVATKDNLIHFANELKQRRFKPGFDHMTAEAAVLWMEINGDRLCDDLLKDRYRPMPAVGFRVAKQSGSYRSLARLTAIDHIIQLALLETLTPIAETVFSNSSFAYRPQRGVAPALRQYCELGSKFRYASKVDPVACYDHIRHNVLEQALPTLSDDEVLRSLIMKYVNLPVVIDQEMIYPVCGIVQGAPLSPMLCNLYFHSLDLMLEKEETVFIRYADDIVLFANTLEEIRTATESTISYMTKTLSLRPNYRKSVIDSPANLSYLGCRFERDRHGLIALQNDRTAQSAYHAWHMEALNNHRHTVDILSDGILRQKDFSLCFESGVSESDIPIMTTNVINVYSNVIFDSGFLERALKYGICVNMFNKQDRLIGRFLPNAPLRSPRSTHEQLMAYFDEKQRLMLAKEFVLASLHNMRLNVRYHRKQYALKDLDHVIKELKQCEVDIKSCKSHEHLLLLEAQIRRTYYGCFEHFLRVEGFAFEKRTRRPPRNEINALMSFGNMVLYSLIAMKLNRSPLDVRIGYLHATTTRQESLNLDVADVFKPLIVDRVALALINREALQKKHFRMEENGGVYLNEDGKRIFLRGLYEKLEETLKIKERTLRYDDLLTEEIRKLTLHFKEHSKFVAYRQVR